MLGIRVRAEIGASRGCRVYRWPDVRVVEDCKDLKTASLGFMAVMYHDLKVGKPRRTAMLDRRVRRVLLWRFVEITSRLRANV